MAVGATGRTWISNFQRQCVYTLGRMFTYGSGGLTAAFLGNRLQAQLPQWVPVQSCLCLFAGLILIFQGLTILGLPRLRFSAKRAYLPCQAAQAFRAILSSPSLWSVFVAGIATGFLPCALIYAYLALAAQSESLLSGALLMISMAAGTAPLMILAGLGVSSFPLRTRQQVLKLAAAIVLVTGVLSILRGFNYWNYSAQSSGKCPMCERVKQ